MSRIVLLVVVLLCYKGCVSQDQYGKRWSSIKYITEHGYPVETHRVVTEDGYILKTLRIPHGRLSNKTNPNPILVTHGMGGCAENFIVLGPDNALAFFLADRGFDVWLFNARGSLHSRKHKTKNPDGFFVGDDFWKFSWHEIGVYDLPANIDYILKKTNKQDLFYIGHSQGGTIYFVLTAEKPEYNKNIRAAALYAPGAFVNYTYNPLIKLMCRFYPILERLAGLFNYYELLIPNSPSLNMLMKQICSLSDDFMEACRDIFTIVGGQQSSLANLSVISLGLDYMPSGFSIRQPFHYCQVVRSGQFKQYDYGRRGNIIKYNTTTPPLYNLSNSVAPVAFFMANRDIVVSDKDTQHLSKSLPNIITTYEVPYDRFNHVDFVIAHNAKELVYEPIYEVLKQFLKE